MSAPNIEDAPLEPARRRFSGLFVRPIAERVEAFLEAERGQLPLWFVASFGAGIAAWLWLPAPAEWGAWIAAALGLAAAGLAWGGGRVGQAMLLGGLTLAAGCGWIWLRSERVAAPRLERAAVVSLTARVDKVEPLVAKGDLRLTLTPDGGELPPRIRVSMPADEAPVGLGVGARISLRARLQPPPPMALPGGHDFARDAWFQERGAVGRAIGPVQILVASPGGGFDALRDRLGQHIRAQLPASSGGIATALANGDQGAVTASDADAMRRSGLAHLLSVSGLHIAAAVGAAMLISLRLLALSERLALRVNLVLVSAVVGAGAGIGYTLLTGMQVPTVRACIAALLVLGGIALGREAISLRLVAVGALIVLLFRPEALAGASFQMSFAAVTAIITLHQFGPVRRLLGPREEGWPMRLARAMIGLLLTGLAVELALMPIALYHFHKAGLYSVAANMIAIPLTTFVIMPLEAGALLLNSIGLGAPLWAATGWTIDLMLGLASSVAEAKNAVTMLPTMPRWAFAAMVFAGLWLCLWRGPIRWWAGVPFALGAIGATAAPVPDLLVTGDGQHLAIVRDDGVPVILRSRSGDFVRSLMSEAAAFDGDPLNLEEQAFARCTRDACIADVVKDGRAWRVLAIRSRDRIEWTQLTSACADADIVVASRRLPKGCTPRWLKLDRAALENSGGVSLYLTGTPRAATVADRLGQHPWRYRPAPWTPRPPFTGSGGGLQPPHDRAILATPAMADTSGQPAGAYPATAPSSASPVAPSSDHTASSLPPGSIK